MTESKPDRQLLKEATDWMIRLSAAPSDRNLREAAEAWRQRDPAHAVAWRQAGRAWRAIGYARPEEETPHVAAEAGQAVPRRRTARWMLATASVLVVLVAALYLPRVGTGLLADHATAVAEHRRVGLQDGTAIELGAATALDVRFDERRRSVDLLAGEAFFSVARDHSRPFVVQARGVSVKVTGTAFNVRLLEDSVAVAVEHGSVEVAATGSLASKPMHLQAGQHLAVARNGSVDLGAIPASEVAAWRRHKLFVDGATVAEVIDELRRYGRGWIVVTDDRLLRQQVAGLYDLRDPEEALRVLVGPFGARVRSVTPLLTVVSGP
jgi:transmembrane sensor